MSTIVVNRYGYETIDQFFSHHASQMANILCSESIMESADAGCSFLLALGPLVSEPRLLPMSLLGI